MVIPLADNSVVAAAAIPPKVSILLQALVGITPLLVALAEIVVQVVQMEMQQT